MSNERFLARDMLAKAERAIVIEGGKTRFF
jgi:hypothetical protein